MPRPVGYSPKWYVFDVKAFVCVHGAWSAHRHRGDSLHVPGGGYQPAVPGGDVDCERRGTGGGDAGRGSVVGTYCCVPWVHLHEEACFDAVVSGGGVGYSGSTVGDAVL